MIPTHLKKLSESGNGLDRSNVSACKGIERNLGMFRRPAQMVVTDDPRKVTCKRCLAALRAGGK